MLAVLSGSGHDNPRRTTGSGTRRARLRLRRRRTKSFEFVHPACLDSITYLPSGRDYSAYIPDHGYFRRHCPHRAGDGPRPVGQASTRPLVSGRSVRRGSRVKRDFACTLTGAFPPVLVALRAQSRLGREGRTRTLSEPSPAPNASWTFSFGDAFLGLRQTSCLPVSDLSALGALYLLIDHHWLSHVVSSASRLWSKEFPNDTMAA